jgi:hypothetical protein
MGLRGDPKGGCAGIPGVRMGRFMGFKGEPVAGDGTVRGFLVRWGTGFRGEPRGGATGLILEGREGGSLLAIVSLAYFRFGGAPLIA